MGFYVFSSCYCCVCPKSNATLLRAFYFAFSIASLRGTSTIFFRHFPEIFFSPRIWLFWFAAPLCGRAKPFQFDYFLFFPFLFFLSAIFFARFGSFRLDFFYIKSAICANVCLPFAVCVFVERRFELFFPFMFSISRASHWSADKQQTSCVFVRWKSALFVCVFICISLFYC